MEGSTIGDEGESKRKMTLVEYVLSTRHEPVPTLMSHRALEEIKNKLQPILERTKMDGYNKNDADSHAVGELAEDARDAIIEYNVSPKRPITVRIRY